MPHDTPRSVAEALMPIATVRAVLLSHDGDVAPLGVDTFPVPPGTKLSKILRFASSITSSYVCICDPDVTVEGQACQSVLRCAIIGSVNKAEVVAFGVINAIDNGSLMSRVIAVDKWLSHCVLRKLLWNAGIGITIPGQFVIVSTELLRSLTPEVDSYLDDLYLGLIARLRRARVIRVPVVVGAEASRDSWIGLLTQRVRWMRGLAFLIGHHWKQPFATLLLFVHYFAYHGLPILLLLLLIVWLTSANPIAGLIAFLGLAGVLATLSNKSIVAIAIYLAALPAVHVIATFFWWVPLSRDSLQQR